MIPSDDGAAPLAKTFRTRALMVNRLRPATRMPATMPASAVLVCVRSRITTAKVTPDQGGSPAQQAGEPEHDRQPGRDRRVLGHLRGRHWPDHPGEPAFEWRALTRGRSGGRAAPSRAPRTGSAADTEGAACRAGPTTASAARARSRTREPEGPVDSAPRCCTAAAVITVSTTSRHTRQRNTFGRTLTLGFTVSASSSASGRAPCASPLPTWTGCAGETRRMKVRVLKNSSAHAAPTLRRTERARAPAESSDATPGRRRSAIDGHQLTTPGVARSARPSPRSTSSGSVTRPSPVTPRVVGSVLRSTREPVYESAERCR